MEDLDKSVFIIWQVEMSGNIILGLGKRKRGDRSWSLGLGEPLLYRFVLKNLEMNCKNSYFSVISVKQKYYTNCGYKHDKNACCKKL